MPRVARVEDWKEEYRSDWYYWLGSDGNWYVSIPGCGIANLASHTVVTHDDGTISVTPSIKVWGHDSAGNEVIRHGYLTNSIWEEC